MENNKFAQDKARVIDSLSNVRKASSDNYDKAQEGLTNSLFTAATAYIAIVLAFANSMQNSVKDCSWIIVASILAFSISLVPWAIEKIVVSIAHGKITAISSKLSKITINEIWDEKELAALDKIAARLLCGGRTSLIPIILQIILFSIGVLFAVIAIAIALL